MHYDRIPKDLHEKIINAVNEKDYHYLLMVHNEYKLTHYNYTCCGVDGLLDHFRHGIEIGAIKIN